MSCSLFFELGRDNTDIRYEFNINIKSHKPIELGAESGHTIVQVGKDLYTYKYIGELGNFDTIKGVF